MVPERGIDLSIGHSRSELESQLELACNALSTNFPAQSPNAKGRVERMFQSLQHRRPQMFRIDGITCIEGANMRIEKFSEKIDAGNHATYTAPIA